MNKNDLALKCAGAWIKELKEHEYIVAFMKRGQIKYPNDEKFKNWKQPETPDLESFIKKWKWKEFQALPDWMFDIEDVQKYLILFW